MKKTKYTEENISLEQAGEYESNGWYLFVRDTMETGTHQTLALEMDEIRKIANVCIEMMLDYEKPPKGVRKAVAK